MVTTLVHWLYQAQTVTSPDPSDRLHGTWRHQCWCKCRSFCCFNICCNQGTFELWYWYTTKNLVYKNKTKPVDQTVFSSTQLAAHGTLQKLREAWKTEMMPKCGTCQQLWCQFVQFVQRDDNGEHNLGCTTPLAPWQLEQLSVVQFSVDGARAELDKELKKTDE